MALDKLRDLFDRLKDIEAAFRMIRRFLDAYNAYYTEDQDERCLGSVGIAALDVIEQLQWTARPGTVRELRRKPFEDLFALTQRALALWPDENQDAQGSANIEPLTIEITDLPPGEYVAEVVDSEVVIPTHGGEGMIITLRIAPKE